MAGAGDTANGVLPTRAHASDECVCSVSELKNYPCATDFDISCFCVERERICHLQSTFAESARAQVENNGQMI